MAANSEAGMRRWCWGGGALHLRQWGDEAALFHEPTVSTHLLDSDTGLVLMALCQARVETSAAALWRTAFGTEPQEGECLLLSETLDTLARAGLVTCAPTP